MVVIGSLSMVGAMGAGVGVLHWEGVGRVLGAGGRLRVVRVGSGSLIYR